MSPAKSKQSGRRPLTRLQASATNRQASGVSKKTSQQKPKQSPTVKAKSTAKKLRTIKPAPPKPCAKPIPPLSDNYVLTFMLMPDWLPPERRIERTLSCPADATFRELHEAVQTAFEWANMHPWTFTIARQEGERISILQLGSSYLLDTEDAGETLLYEILEPMTWPNMQRLSDYRSSCADNDFFEKVSKNQPEEQLHLSYEYDMGDSWDHFIFLKARAETTAPGHFICLAGVGHPAAEDCGGVTGWEALLNAYKTKRPSANARELREWYETECANGDPKGLRGERAHYFDIDEVNAFLAQECLEYQRKKLGCRSCGSHRH